MKENSKVKKAFEKLEKAYEEARDEHFPDTDLSVADEMFNDGEIDTYDCLGLIEFAMKNPGLAYVESNGLHLFFKDAESALKKIEKALKDIEKAKKASK